MSNRLVNDKSDRKTYQELWEDRWKRICTNEDGSLNLDQIQRELYDYSFLLEQVPTVYEEVAGLSKTNYYAKGVIEQYWNKVNDIVKDRFNEVIKELQEEIDDHRVGDYKDGLQDALDIIFDHR